MPTREQAFNDWFHGDPSPGPDVREAFRAGWAAREKSAAVADAVKAAVDTPEIVFWTESVTLQQRVSLPRSEYERLLDRHKA